ncbi:MAG TPA: HNH endonuclease signature motif containing protein [Streptosporangiaceae bacterium]|nr:HNH endonuclease signature motif containing protein [Streptosporangiaceae bacterium]
MAEEFGVTAAGELDLGLGPAPAPADERAGARPGRPAPGPGLAPGSVVMPGLAPDAEPPPPAEGEASWETWVDLGWEPGDYGDPETDPDDFDVFLAGMPEEVRADLLAGPFTGDEGPIPAGFLHHERGGPTGVGFASGGVLDGMEPGPWLARALDAATAGGHSQLGESELIGVLCASRRIASWAAASEAAAVVTLARRRAAQSAAPGSSRLVEHVSDEVAAALTLTGRSADRLLSVASGLTRLPAVLTALKLGEIDWPRACVFVDELAALADDALAQGIAARFLGRAGAGGWTTGQLRAALRRAVLAADPSAADRRKAEASSDACVRAWGEASGNAGLSGRELPPAEVLAADARLTALARWLQRRGAAGTLSQLRAAVYTALLNGRSLELVLASLAGDDDAAAQNAAAQNAAAQDAASAGARSGGETAGGDSAGHDDMNHRGEDAEAGGGGWPAVSGTIHLTMPLSAWLGGGEPGEVAGHGPVDASTSRDLAAMLASSVATRWCVTATGPDGRAAGHACARRGPAAGEPAIRWAAGLRAKLQLLETDSRCSHPRQSPGYVPPASLRHLIAVRQRTCAYPGCRRPAARCDVDHTVPYDKGGRTCECNLAPLCRRHHRAKQAPGWHLEQPEPGRMTWRTPSGRIYETTGDPY